MHYENGVVAKLHELYQPEAASAIKYEMNMVAIYSQRHLANVHRRGLQRPIIIIIINNL